MKSISLCMIVKDEELVLSNCLETIKDIVDEIIIVDTGSTDKTKEIAKLYTDQIYDFKWRNDFSAARNYSFSKATKDYILWLDADDILMPEDQTNFRLLKDTLTDSIDMVIMKYNVAFDTSGNPSFSYNRERLLKRSVGYLWSGQIHEAISYYGNILYSDIAITHKKQKNTEIDRNLKIYESMLSKKKILDPREQFYYGRELMYNNHIEAAINVFQSFLDTKDGWIENKISACKDLSRCYFRQQKDDLGLLTLFRSFQFDEPRAEICCDIGYYFFSIQEYKRAIFWYELCLTRTLDKTSGAFFEIDCYNYIPYMQLCVCYDRMGDKKRAFECNESAGKYKPYDENYLYNKKYFEKSFESI